MVVVDGDVEIAVVVVVRHGQAATVGQEFTREPAARNLLELPAVHPSEQLHGLGVDVGIREDGFRVADSPVGDEQVEHAVVVEVFQSFAESGHLQARRSQARARGNVAQPTVAVVHVVGIGLPAQVGDEQVEVAILVEISGHGSHAGLHRAVDVHRTTAHEGLVDELPIPVVHPQLIGHPVIGHVHVAAPIAVEIAERQSETIAEGRRESGAGSAVVKAALSVVDVQNALGGSVVVVG
jgi:hypothetical protein